MKVLFIVPYPEHQAPSQRLKFEQYYAHFREAGIEVVHDPFMSDAFWKIVYKNGQVWKKTLYVIQAYFRRLRSLLSLRKYDLVYLTDAKSTANGFVGFLKGRKKPIYLMKHSDHVITCTPYLDNFVRKFNQQTTDISSTIDTEKYRPRKDYALIENELVLGWSGSHSTSAYLQLLKPVLLRLKEEGLNFRLLVMGDPRFAMDGIKIEALTWKEEYEVDVISRFDIGLYPLPDEEWVYGKSGLKALQYMAAGVPTIATAIGTNFRIIEDGVNGYLVNSEDQWHEKIKSLAADKVLRQQMGKKGAEIIEAKYSIHQNKSVYLSILREDRSGKTNLI